MPNKQFWMGLMIPSEPKRHGSGNIGQGKRLRFEKYQPTFEKYQETLDRAVNI